MKTVHVDKPKNMKFIVGRETTGMAFRVEASTEHGVFDFAEAFRQLKKNEILSAIAIATEEKKINKYEYTITYDHDKSQAKAVQFTAKYGELNKKPESSSYAFKDEERTTVRSPSNGEHVFDDNLAIPTNTAPASSERLQQFLHRVAETMKSEHHLQYVTR